MELGVIFLHVFYCMVSKWIMEEKNLQKFARCLATFKDITLHAVNCKALKFTRLMFEEKKKEKLFSVVSWEGDHYCHVGPKKNTHLRSNCHQTNSSLFTSSEKTLWFLGTVRSVTNVKQANVKMLLSALAPCVLGYQACISFQNRLNLT